MIIKHFFDQETFTLTYAVSDEQSKDCIIIDPVLNYDSSTGTISDHSVLELVDYIKSNHLRLKGILETHAHADHLSGQHFLKKFFPEAISVIGEKIKLVQEVFKNHFNMLSLKTDGSQFDKLLADFEEIHFGTINLMAIPTPGHTPACMSFLIGDAIFTGDALFMPDYGTGRCDFPKGSAEDLYDSVKNNLYSLPDATRVYVGHDYSPEGREMQYQTTIADSKRCNIQLADHVMKRDFVHLREKRDATLKAPKLLIPSIQVNIHAGQLPKAEENGKIYLKTPLDIKLKN
jgi:glyoxylase-like metal-dependent hydrolase (beta-lactamase superfamily II)